MQTYQLTTHPVQVTLFTISFPYNLSQLPASAKLYLADFIFGKTDGKILLSPDLQVIKMDSSYGLYLNPRSIKVYCTSEDWVCAEK